MSKRKDRIKQQKAMEKQKVKAAKKARQKNDPAKWEEKKRKKQQFQRAYKEGKFPGINQHCQLKPFQNPSPDNCNGCELKCPYNNCC